MKTELLLCAALLAGLSGCKREPHADPAMAAQAAKTQAANEGAAAFDDAVSKQNWALAKAQGEVLLAEYPDSEAAKHVRAQFEEIKAKADVARDTLRTAALWSYDVETVKGGKQLSAAIYSKDEVDTTGAGASSAQPVRLIFRDHPSWGKSSYLVLQTGDFDCYSGCKVKVKIDDSAPKTMAALRPKTDDAIAMFVNDERVLWRMTRDAKLLSIEFPVKAGGKRTAVFEVAGLDRGKLPAWN